MERAVDWLCEVSEVSEEDKKKHMKKCKVPLTILDQTNHCNYDFSCLGTGKYKGPDGCEVDYLYGENILFLKNSEHSHACPYRAHFNSRQMCLCPTKYDCYSQRQDEDSVFKQCPLCETVWRNYHDFLSDPYVSLAGYQMSFKELEAGLFLFHHSCTTTLALPATAFAYLYDGPIFEERTTGTDKCPEYCLREDALGPCPIKCECAYVSEVLRIVKNWPKVGGAFRLMEVVP